MVRVSATAVLVTALAGCAPGSRALPPGSPPPAAGAVPAGVAARGLITHVVVIVQENRSFDDLFGGGVPGASVFPGADGNVVAPGAPPISAAGFDTAIPNNGHDVFRCLQVNGYGAGIWQQLADGVWPSSPQPCPTSAPPANPHKSFAADPQALTVVRDDHRSVYWDVARTYELGDAFYAAESGNSFPGHQFVVALNSQNDLGDVISDQPYINDAAGGDCGTVLAPGDLEQAPVYDRSTGFTSWVTDRGSNTYCWSGRTFADNLDAAKVGWVHYSTDPSNGVFDGFINFRAWYPQTKSPDIPGGRFRVSRLDFVPDMQSGGANALPSFTWVKPPCIYYSDHPGTSQSPYGGQDWVATAINAIGADPERWKHTAIFVVWDDEGGFYDHAVLPQGVSTFPNPLTPGMRQPFLVISPYGRDPGSVVHAPANYGSVLKFAEDLFRVGPLNGYDANAPDLGPFFDFTRSPRAFTAIPLLLGNFDPPTNCAQNPGLPASQIDD